MKKLKLTRRILSINTIIACTAIALLAGCQSGKHGGPEAGHSKPDLAAAATKLGITENQMKAALGDPKQGRPDFAKAAKILGITEKQLTDALGTSKDGRPSK